MLASLARFILCPAMLAAALAVSPALAQEGDHYTAVSKTAMSITGDVWMDDSGIAFENGETLDFSDLVADNFRVSGKNVPASVYRVAEPADPELENGNRLCGSGNVTYVATWAAGDGMTSIAVFTGRQAPKSSDGMCALFNYEDPK